jgi:hypothetical protein
MINDIFLGIGGHIMKTIIHFILISCCILFLASCASDYSVTHAQSQGTTISGMRKHTAYGYGSTTMVQSIDQKGVMAAGSFWDPVTYNAPVIPNQPHIFTVLAYFMNGYWKGEYKGTGNITATLQPGYQYVVAAKVDKADNKDLDIWIQIKGGKRVTPSVVVHCHRVSLL